MTYYSTLTSGTSTTGDILPTSTYTITSQSYCTPCNTWYWGWHTCSHKCSKSEHNFVQAEKPHDDVIFCSHCGKVKSLKRE